MLGITNQLATIPTEEKILQYLLPSSGTKFKRSPSGIWVIITYKLHAYGKEVFPELRVYGMCNDSLQVSLNFIFDLNTKNRN